MKDPYVIFKGVRSDELGVIVEQLPDIHRAQRNIQELTIPGRDGMLVRDLGGWTLNTATMRINCNGVPLHTVYAWLSGEGWLTTSDEPDVKIYTYAWNSITDTRFRVDGRCYDSLSINLRMDPFRYLIDGETLTFETADMAEPSNDLVSDLWNYTSSVWDVALKSYEVTFQGAGSFWARPVITITPTRTVRHVLAINGWSFHIDADLNLPVVIDCENMRVYRINQDGSFTNMSRYVTIDTDETDEWPRLYPEGQTNVLHWPYRQAGSDIAKIEIAPNWRWM